ncbi:molybdopterin-dependent oxidoreductase [Nocardioides sp. Bht2]|uniref:molybdopterin-dependent oxidoreductase n=1 Tax=Nocardioides sp. Bht2 TaxID=3392297 RepID=UPI0039B3FCBE
MDASTSTGGRWLWAGFGLLASVAGIAAAHLIAAATNPAASPVLAVGSNVIDLTPTPVKTWAIREFGTSDKPILIGSVFAGVLILAALAGIAARRRLEIGIAFVLVLAAVAGAAAWSRPVATPRDLLPALTAAVVGSAVLIYLARLTRVSAGAPATSSPTTESLETPTEQNGTARTPALPRAQRRTVLIAGAVIAAASGATAAGGRWLSRIRSRVTEVALPRPAVPAPPLPADLANLNSEISALRTPRGEFYRVDINLTVPVVSLDDWDLRIDGDVENPFRLTFDDLLAMELIERDITLTCVSNEVGGKYVGAARWLGVSLKELLDRAGVKPGNDQLLSTATDGFTISTPLEIALKNPDAMVAIGMNGKSLPADHGFPARLVVPGLYGYVGATKWLRRLTVTTYDADEAYWTERGWSIDGPIKASARIDTPRPFAKVKAGTVVIGGVAWAQGQGVARVEVQIDDGPWQPAILGGDVNLDYWRQWYLPWEAMSGSHSVAVRTTTDQGEVQTPVRVDPFPNGSSGIQQIQVNVD